ncbi:MAG TPA: hypothetical protein PLU10_06565 [Chitinophagaceae bacterium]|nr:hypothetical protein [Chitinophagaceae bacterium]
MDNSGGIYRIAFINILIIQIVIFSCLPLVHMMNDSGWYFMNVHFVNTGTYINESRYPSFSEPSQYYPFLGYSVFLFLCDQLASLFHISAVYIIKYAQLLLYVLSAIWVVKIMQAVTNRISFSYMIGILFLLYYPYFNYTNLVMSEMYATFFVLFTIYLFTRFQVDENKITLTVLCLSAGYLMLIKPVLLPATLCLALLLLIKFIYAQKYKQILFILLILVAPLFQMGFSETHYGNSKIQSGLGWHLWDRVIFHDQNIPKNSKHWKALEEIYASHQKIIPIGYWWDIAKDLSEFGYSESETNMICERIAFDAIANRPFYYIQNTLMMCYENFLQLNSYNAVYAHYEEYINEIENFSNEQQHKPLTDELLKQKKQDVHPMLESIISFNFKLAEKSERIYLVFHNSFVFILFIITGFISNYKLISSRFKKNQIEWLIWITACAILFGSNMAEYSQARLMLPAVILIVMSIGIEIEKLFSLYQIKKNTSIN